jgi:hypothetical protein
MTIKTDNADLQQIGLTPEGQANLEALMRTKWFATGQDVYLLSIAVALANDVIASPEQVRGSETRYNFMGGLDKEGKVRLLISALRPIDASLPARAAERLAHAGLIILAEKLAGEDAMISDALGYHEEDGN